ncbi:Rrf2 family transcriptional regulator [Olsenella sp. SW781]|uniref:Rrf2 family transcriptional regulator n=1 Tax=Olsenella sp. SW781 TaxID=2530046 RepID=UPI00143BDC1A
MVAPYLGDLLLRVELHELRVLVGGHHEEVLARDERVEVEVSSAAIAKSLATNPSSVRQLMGRLRRAGLITSVTGRARPELARAAEDVMASVTLERIIAQYRERVDAL